MKIIIKLYYHQNASDLKKVFSFKFNKILLYFFKAKSCFFCWKFNFLSFFKRVRFESEKFFYKPSWDLFQTSQVCCFFLYLFKHFLKLSSYHSHFFVNMLCKQKTSFILSLKKESFKQSFNILRIETYKMIMTLLKKYFFFHESCLIFQWILVKKLFIKATDFIGYFENGFIICH